MAQLQKRTSTESSWRGEGREKSRFFSVVFQLQFASYGGIQALYRTPYHKVRLLIVILPSTCNVQAELDITIITSRVRHVPKYTDMLIRLCNFSEFLVACNFFVLQLGNLGEKGKRSCLFLFFFSVSCICVFVFSSFHT